MASNFTEDNRRFFDDLAAKYDIKPWQRDLSAKITTYIQEQLDFIGIPASPSSLLDYACGTGMITRALGPYIDNIQAIDLSANMVSRYQELAASSEVPSVKGARARIGNLLSDEGQEEEGELAGEEMKGFSVAAVGLGVHHFADPGLAIKRLAGRLRLGGVLLIVDFVEEKGTHLPSPAEHTIHKHGFTQNEMLGLMVNAGLVDFSWKEMPRKVELRMCEERPVYRTVFLARAIRTY